MQAVRISRGWAMLAKTRQELMDSQLLALSVRNRPRSLTAMMRALASNNSRISFEGWLSATDLHRLEGIDTEGNAILKRNTLSPKLDFLITPLTDQSEPLIERAIHAKLAFKAGRGLIHVQIERDGELAFAAFDSFQHCVVKRSAIPPTLVLDLLEQRILRTPR